jgi:hypothetical protein
MIMLPLYILWYGFHAVKRTSWYGKVILLYIDIDTIGTMELKKHKVITV